MKKNLLLVSIIFFSIMVQAQDFAIDGNVTEKENPITLKKSTFSNIPIPDTNFEQALIDLGYDTNGLNGNILTSDAVAVTSLSLSSAISAAITDLTGIEGFTQLTSLRITSSNITTIDLSDNTVLEELTIFDTQITSSDLSNLSSLRILYLVNNPISSIDLSSNIALEELTIFDTQITSSDLSNLSSLRILYLVNNPISSIDLSSNIALEELSIRDTQIEALDLSSLSSLRILNLVRISDLDNNPISSIDLSNNIALEQVMLQDHVYANLLDISAIDFSNNINLRSLYLAHLKSLTSLSLGDNDVLSGIDLWETDALPSLDVSQNNGLSFLNIVGNNLLSTLTLNSSLQYLSLTSNISLSTDFTHTVPNLLELNARSNNFTTIDLTKNTRLENLDLDSNLITEIDLSKNTQLKMLNMDGSPITEIDLSKNAGLLILSLENCSLSNIDLSNNPNLRSFDLSNNSNITYTSAHKNSISSLDLANNTFLNGFDIDANNLSSLDLTNNTFLTNFSISENNISSLDLTNNTLLETITASDNQIELLNLSNLTSLRFLDLQRNSLKYLNIKNGNNAALIRVNINENPSLECVQVDDVDFANANFTKDATTSFNLSCFAGGDWSDPASWSDGVVPTSNDNVTIPAGTTLQIGAEISEINSLVNEGSIVIVPTFSLKSNTTLVNNGSIVMESESNNSSVLFVQGASSGTVTYKRGGLKANAWSLVAPPVSGQKIEEFALNADNDIRINTSVSPNRYAIAYHDDTAIEGEKWKYYTTDIASSLTFTAGESYSMSRGTDGAVSFTGALTTADVSKSLNAGAWSAIGNPFTTYYPANKNSENSFLNQNFAALDDAFKAVYLWSTTQNKFVSVTEIDISNRSLTPGQGFFIKLKPSATSVQFNEDKRSLKPNDATNTFAKNNDLYAELALENDNYNVKTAIKFYPNATLGFDVGYDIRNFDGASFDVFTHLADQSSENNFSIQSVPSADMENTIVPLGVNLPNEEKVKFTLSAVNLPEEINVFIEDRMLNTFNNMSSDNTYVPDFSQNKNLKDRFFVHFKTASALSTNTPTLNEIHIFVKERVLFVEGIKTEKALKVFNTLGQELFTVNLEADSNQVNLPNHIKSGIYLISIKAESQTHTQRILLK